MSRRMSHTRQVVTLTPGTAPNGFEAAVPISLAATGAVAEGHAGLRLSSSAAAAWSPPHTVHSDRRESPPIRHETGPPTVTRWHNSIITAP